MIEESFNHICSIWNEVGIHSQETRDQMKKRYIISCKDALGVHLNKMSSEEENVPF